MEQEAAGVTEDAAAPLLHEVGPAPAGGGTERSVGRALAMWEEASTSKSSQKSGNDRQLLACIPLASG